jgi:hypothetical protein
MTLHALAQLRRETASEPWLTEMALNARREAWKTWSDY